MRGSRSAGSIREERALHYALSRFAEMEYESVASTPSEQPPEVTKPSVQPPEVTKPFVETSEVTKPSTTTTATPSVQTSPSDKAANDVVGPSDHSTSDVTSGTTTPKPRRSLLIHSPKQYNIRSKVSQATDVCRNEATHKLTQEGKESSSLMGRGKRTIVSTNITLSTFNFHEGTYFFIHRQFGCLA